jgi:hypothetical protein
VSGAFDSLTGKADDAIGQIGGGIAHSGSAVVAVINSAHDHVAQQTQRVVGQARGQVIHQGKAITDRMASVAAQSNKAAVGTISQVAASLDSKLGEVDQAFGKSLGDYRAKLTDQVDSADAKARDPLTTLPSRIGDAQSRAEERAKRDSLSVSGTISKKWSATPVFGRVWSWDFSLRSL